MTPQELISAIESEGCRLVLNKGMVAFVENRRPSNPLMAEFKKNIPALVSILKSQTAGNTAPAVAKSETTAVKRNGSPVEQFRGTERQPKPQTPQQRTASAIPAPSEPKVDSENWIVDMAALGYRDRYPTAGLCPICQEVLTPQLNKEYKFSPEPLPLYYVECYRATDGDIPHYYSAWPIGWGSGGVQPAEYDKPGHRSHHFSGDYGSYVISDNSGLLFEFGLMSQLGDIKREYEMLDLTDRSEKKQKGKANDLG